jgi:hypothetical protein
MEALTLPVLGPWPGWMTVLVVALVVLYLLQRLAHLIDSDLDDDTSDEPQPGDVSTLAGWEEYVLGNRVEREVFDGDHGSEDVR